MANQIPTVFIIFGATGDLMGKKIVPALFHLFQLGKLHKFFRIIGFARKAFTKEAFQKYIANLIPKQEQISKKRLVAEFVQYFSYHQGDFHNMKSYMTLAQSLGHIDGEWRICSNKLFYLAVPPQYTESIFKNLSVSGLTIPCGPDGGWTRVIVEKPFGHDLKTAEALDLLLGTLFKEEQLYRIDHYLAKDMLQNILNFRFANNLLEDAWNNKNIEKIEIRLLEKLGVEERGQFYDGLGTLRDVGQNHLLQMLALITMDNPGTYDADAVRRKRYEILHTLRTLQEKDIIRHTYRAQYIGYRKVEGVAQGSKTETFFNLRLFLDSPRWRGVPVFLESGKRMKKQLKEIVVTFRHSLPCLCPPGKHYKNSVKFQIEPQEKIQINFVSKKPGLEAGIQEKSLSFLYRNKSKKMQYVEEYEKLLLDCIEGNQLLFVSTNEIREMWKFIDPIIEAWQKNKVPLEYYEPESDRTIVESRTVVSQFAVPALKREVAIVGLGKMGTNLALQLVNKGWKVTGFNRSNEDTKRLEKEGLIGAYSLSQLMYNLNKPRIIWLMLPAGGAIDEILFHKGNLFDILEAGDIIIDGGNSFYKDSIIRAQKLAKRGIRYADVGISGGPGGARYGASFMVGGEIELFEYLNPLFTETAVPSGVQFFKGIGAGHFVKMIHNGIEYGMMQAIAEGFTVLKHCKYDLHLSKVADIYNHGSVIESRLIGWLKDGFELFSNNLEHVSGTVKNTGEGKWTVETAKELKIKSKIIEEAYQFRIDSEKNPDYTGKILSLLRNRFGGHSLT